MAAGEPDQPQQVEALIDELIVQILDRAEQGQPAKAGRVHAALPGGLLDGVRSTMARGSGGSMLERLLLAEALAGVLADALAPALAEMLAPRIMKILEGDEPAAGTEPPAKTPAGRSRKSDSN